MQNSPENPLLFVATKAFITLNNKVLVLRESSKYKDGSNANKFDVVGGRLEPGQHFKESLLREIQEETGITVDVKQPFFVNEWRPTVRNEYWQIVGIFFHCTTLQPDIILSEDHDAYKWIDPKEYKNEQIIENLYPAFETFLNL